MHFNSVWSFFLVPIFGLVNIRYLFFGHAGTFTKLHRDPGGLDITISALTGAKECILVHRDDAALLYRCQVDLKNPDLTK